MENQTNQLVPDISELEKAFNGDVDLLLFFVTWMKQGLNATEAYHELHPKVTRHSAEVLGSRWLGRVEKSVVMAVYGLGVDRYMEQLRDGLKAIKVNEFDGTTLPDHVARKPYHDKLGKLLGIEQDKALIQINNQQNNLSALTDDQLDQLIKVRLRETGAGSTFGGEETPQSVESSEVRTPAPEAVGGDTQSASDPRALLG